MVRFPSIDLIFKLWGKVSPQWLRGKANNSTTGGWGSKTILGVRELECHLMQYFPHWFRKEAKLLSQSTLPLTRNKGWDLQKWMPKVRFLEWNSQKSPADLGAQVPLKISRICPPKSLLKILLESSYLGAGISGLIFRHTEHPQIQTKSVGAQHFWKAGHLLKS